MNGNQVAQEKLYNKYKRSVENFIRSKYSTYYDLDDDVSEIMIKIFMNLNSFDFNKSKFSSWVFSIAKNYMIDKWRNSAPIITSNVSENITFTNFIDNNISTNLCDINSTISNNSLFDLNSYSITNNITFENDNSINYISAQLSAQDFTLLDMKYIQGYDYNEIGKEFNVTSTTISNRVNYIKSKLKKNNLEIIYE